MKAWSSSLIRRLAVIFLLTALAGCTSQPAQGPSLEAPAGIATQTAAAASQLEQAYEQQRLDLVEHGVKDWGVEDEAVLDVLRRVPRHEFVPENVLSMAYENHPLPIGYGQTISQPYIVGLMTESIQVGKGDTVLEIGSGSGYQAAVLAELVDQVYTMEIIPQLAERAEATLERLGYTNISVRNADGYNGWPEHAPYDAIMVTAAPDHVPQPLVQQLKVGGRMVIPVGPVAGAQTLWLIRRTSETEVSSRGLGAVAFVPLTRSP